MATIPLASSVRTLNRLRQIARVLATNGFGHVVERLNLGRYLPMGKRVRPDSPGPLTSHTSVGRRLTKVCHELGPTFVKLGQMLSTRPDLVAADIARELRSLQDHVPAFDTEIARRSVAEDLGAPIDKLFAHFDDAPIASGSIGQVHAARTHAGEDVVVKIKRPGIDETIRHDLHILRWMAETMERFVDELAMYRPSQIVQEFSILISQETDFIREASNTTRFHDAFESTEHLTTPRVHWDLTGPRVLTMSRVRGESIEKVIDRHDQSINRQQLGLLLINLYLKQFFDLRLFHADPHPGNILVRQPAEIGLIDFGQVGTLSDELAGQLVTIVAALVYREPQVVVDVLSDLDAVSHDTDARALSRALRQLLDKYYGLPLKRLDLVIIFAELTDTIRAHHVSMPRELVSVIKTMVHIAGVALKLDPELNLAEVVAPRVKKLLTDRFSPKRLSRAAVVSLWHLSSILKSAPSQIRGVLRQISRGSWQVNIRHENLDRLTEELDRSSNRMSFSVVIAAVIVGSSVVISASDDAQILNIPLRWIGVAGYLFAGMMGAGLVWAIIRSGRLS